MDEWDSQIRRQRLQRLARTAEVLGYKNKAVRHRATADTRAGEDKAEYGARRFSTGQGSDDVTQALVCLTSLQVNRARIFVPARLLVRIMSRGYSYALFSIEV